MSAFSLLPPEWQERLGRRAEGLPEVIQRRLVGAVGFLAAVQVLFWFWLGFLSGRVPQLDAAIDRASQELEAQSVRSAQLAEALAQAQREHEQLSQRVAYLQRETELTTRWRALLEEISRLLPEDAWLSSVAVEQGALRIEGGAPDHEIVGEFVSRLGRSPYLTEVGVTQTETQEFFESPVVTFEVGGALSVGAKRRRDVGSVAAAAGS
jgi:Tfp pilus assembly protein PilN